MSEFQKRLELRSQLWTTKGIFTLNAQASTEAGALPTTCRPLLDSQLPHGWLGVDSLGWAHSEGHLLTSVLLGPSLSTIHVSISVKG